MTERPTRIGSPRGEKPLWIRKSAPPSVRAVQRFESDGTARLVRAGATTQTAKALVSRAFGAVVAGDSEDLDEALDAAVAAAGGALASAWLIDANRAGAIDALGDALPEEDPLPGTAADPKAQSDALEAEIRRVAMADGISVAKARTRLLKAMPEAERAALYANASSLPVASETPPLVEPSFAEVADGAMAVALEKRRAEHPTEPIGASVAHVVAANPELAQLAAIASQYPEDARRPIDDAVSRLAKKRSDVDVLGVLKRAVPWEATIASIQKRRAR